MHPMGLRVLQQRPSHGSEGSPPNSDICLGSAERGAKHIPWRRPSHRRRRPQGRRSARPMDLGTHGGVCDLAIEGRCSMDLGTKVTDRSAPRKIYGAQHTDPVTHVDGPVMTEVLLCLVSMVSGCGRRSAAVTAPGRYQRLKNLANEWEVWDRGPTTPINNDVGIVGADLEANCNNKVAKNMSDLIDISTKSRMALIQGRE
jgi:hypothetical protein